MLDLKQKWEPQIEKLIAGEFENCDQAWANLKDVNIKEYETSKLKKFMTLVRSIMQDSLLALCKKSYKSFRTHFRQFYSDNVEIHTPNKILNYFPNGSVLNS